jgi:ribosome biogenesis GTPase / thiamine phosphate phosphatase
MIRRSENVSIENLGYNAFFESAFVSLHLHQSSPARVIAEHREAYKVMGIDGEFTAKISGKLHFQASKREDYPAVGDWVAITQVDRESAIIEALMPRKTILRKKFSDKRGIQVIAANLDTAFIVEAVDRDYNLNRLERYLVLAKEGAIEAVIVLNKTDLISSEELETKIRQLSQRFPDTAVIATSIATEKGITGLAHSIQKGKTYCFLGSSGVGKSSLINKLLGSNLIKTKEVSLYSGRGKHCTTSRHVYSLENGGIVIDNPGIREVGIADATSGVEAVFEEIVTTAQKCRFSDCTHTHEPGCAVLEAVKDNNIDGEKLTHFEKLKKETEHYAMTDYEKRKKDRTFGKFVKKALTQLKSKEL